MKIINQNFGGGAYFSLTHNAGFTLAEVLVTLGIIGVISAMTLPTLVKNHQRQVYVTQLHKVYNDLSQAAERIITDSNAVNLCESKFGKEGPQLFYKNYLKTVKFCSESNITECFANEYKNMNGKILRTRNVVVPGSNDSCAVLASGASICFYSPHSYNGGYFGHSNITLDVNGKQGPNILGRDLFSFIMENDGTITTGENLETATKDFSSMCAGANEDAYGACFARILNDGWKMDY